MQWNCNLHAIIELFYTMPKNANFHSHRSQYLAQNTIEKEILQLPHQESKMSVTTVSFLVTTMLLLKHI